MLEPGGLTTSYTYDWMNHVSCVDMDRGGTPTAATTYVSNGVTCTTLFLSGTGTRQTRTFVYDTGGRLTSATNPENGTVTYTYNSDNTLQKKQDANGQDTVYTYDSLKRVTQIQPYFFVSGRSILDTCGTVTYTYDTNPVNPNFSQNSQGRLTTAQYYAPNSNIPLGSYIGDGNGGWTTYGCTADAYAEMYSYHAAGAVTAKKLQFTRVFASQYGYRQTGTGSLEVDYAQDSAGRTSTVTYPMTFANLASSQPVLTTAYDTKGRPASLTDTAGDGVYPYAPANWASAAYDYAGRLTSLSSFFAALNGSGSTPMETRGYNVNGQLTSINWFFVDANSGIQYVYSPTHNNGQITQEIDSFQYGRQVTTTNYQYDALKRVTSAAMTETAGTGITPWTQTFQYDGFGNLTSKDLNGTTTPIAVDATKNRLTNAYYDFNGNMTSGAGATFAYDEANRISSVTETSGCGGILRLRRGEQADLRAGYERGRVVHVLRGEGRKAGGVFPGDRTCANNYNYQQPGTCNYSFVAQTTNVWFAGRLIMDSGSSSNGYGWFYQDRKGLTGLGGYLPYGETVNAAPGDDKIMFATYLRDSFTGLDYADQRFYASSYGRFNTADPYMASAGPSDPGSWNRYAYTGGDPVNRADPRGTCDLAVSGWGFNDGWFAYTSCDASLASDINPAALAECFAVNTCLANFQAAQGGGGSPAAAHITALIAPGTTQNEQQALQAGLDQAWAEIVSQPTCASFLTGNSAPGSYLANLAELANIMSNTTYTFGPTDPGAAAQTNAVGGNQVTINASGAFFASPGAAGTVQVIGPNSTDTGIVIDTYASSVVNQAELLLHELGHEMGVLGPDAGPGAPVGMNYTNNQAVLDNCFTQNAQGVYH